MTFKSPFQTKLLQIPNYTKISIHTVGKNAVRMEGSSKLVTQTSVKVFRSEQEKVELYASSTSLWYTEVEMQIIDLMLFNTQAEDASVII